MFETKDTISRIKEILPSLSKSEKQLAEAILEDVNFAIHSSTSEMAKKSGVSSPTITRFCRSLGLEGLKNLKVQLAQSLSVGNRYISQQITPKNIQEVAENVISGAQLALHQLHQSLDYTALEQAANAISSAHSVTVFGGGGGSSMIAQDAQHRLFRLSVQVATYTDSQLQRMVASTLKENDVLLVISTSGRDQEIKDCAIIAKEYNAKVVAITRPLSPLAKAADIVIEVDIPESKDILKPTASRFALLAALDILANQVARNKGSEATETLRRIKYQLVSTRDEDDSQSLGD